MWQTWLIIAGFFLVMEMFTPGFLVFWIALAAALTSILSLVVTNIIFETIFFIIVLSLLLFFTKPLVDKFINKDKTVATNAYSIIGKKAIVTKDIDPTKAKGQIKVNGEVWSAKTEDDSFIEKDSEVEVKKIDGVKAIVSTIK